MAQTWIQPAKESMEQKKSVIQEETNHTNSKLFRRRERQAPFAVEEPFQPLVTGTAFTADDFWCD
jgi:hypothetical protein